VTTDQEVPVRRPVGRPPGARTKPPVPVPADPVPLPQGMLACRACGIAASGESETVEVAAISRQGDPPGPRSLPVFTFGRCSACTQRADRARSLLTAHPSIAGRLGNVAAHRLACALDAVAALGLDLGELPEDSEALLWPLMEHLAGPGSAAGWVSRFSPTWHSGADPDLCNPRPWSHVGGDSRDSLGRGYARVLVARVALSAPPVRLGPPLVDASLADAVAVEGGCLMCGVVAITLSAAVVVRLGGRHGAARQVWRPATQTVPGSVDTLAGYLCPPCEDARGDGAVGTTAAAKAFLAHVEVTDPTAAEQLRGSVLDGADLPGYGDLVYVARRTGRAGPVPSTEPWAHVA